ncbi:MAG: hypothetical protein QM784_01225 [Polyangiaceae bacterium]
MTRTHADTNQPDIESLLATERELIPEDDALRQRVLQRARASLPLSLRRPIVVTPPKPRRLRLGALGTAAIVLPALCAAAFYAGYQLRSRTPSVAPPLAPSTEVTQPTPPEPSVVVALVSVDSSTGAPLMNTETALRNAGATTKPLVTAKAATEIEAYALELQVLQPARQAVAQRHFASALGAIAEHQRKFPSGKLTEEREALRVKALLGLGRTAEAQRVASAFRTRFPRSALLGRIDEMLGAQK